MTKSASKGTPFWHDRHDLHQGPMMADPPTPPSNTSAVIILGNDGVATWLEACLNSLRLHSSTIQCCILPFDENLKRTKEIARRHNAKIINPPHLDDLVAIGRTLCPGKKWAHRCFRKFGVFWSGFDQVLYVDADIVFLKPVEPLFAALSISEKDLLYADKDLERVYIDSRFRQQMIDEHGSQGINTGFWTAKGNLFSYEEVLELAKQAHSARKYFDPITMEQPFLNYCLDVAGLSYDHFSTVLPGFPDCSWGSLKALRRKDGVWCCSYQHNRASTPLFFLHWAGSSFSWAMPNREIFLDALLLHRNPVWSSALKLTWYLRYLSQNIRMAFGLFRRRRGWTIPLERQ